MNRIGPASHAPAPAYMTFAQVENLVPRTPRRPHRRNGAGLTLLECVAAMVVLSLVLLAVLSTSVAGQQRLSAADRAMTGTRVGRDLLEEVSSMAYKDPGATAVFGAEPDESGRQTWDDVDDYHGYSEAPGLLRDARGRLYPAESQEYRRSATVVAQTLNLPQLGAVPGKLVTVTVEHPRGGTWTHARFIPQPPD